MGCAGLGYIGNYREDEMCEEWRRREWRLWLLHDSRSHTLSMQMVNVTAADQDTTAVPTRQPAPHPVPAMRCHEIRYEEISVTKLEPRLYLEVKSVFLPSRSKYPNLSGDNASKNASSVPGHCQQSCWTRQPGGTADRDQPCRAARILVMATAYEMRPDCSSL